MGVVSVLAYNLLIEETFIRLKDTQVIMKHDESGDEFSTILCKYNCEFALKTNIK